VSEMLERLARGEFELVRKVSYWHLPALKRRGL
jgi:hypothetical protein